jgi:hypothetical protein
MIFIEIPLWKMKKKSQLLAICRLKMLRVLTRIEEVLILTLLANYNKDEKIKALLTNK